MYKTVYTDQSEILHAINALYLSGEGIDLDPMYGKGGFYKQFPEPTWASDLAGGKRQDGSCPISIQDATDVLWTDGCMRSMILDPPFMHAQGKDSALSRYASYPSQKALRVLYDKLLVEAHRVLVPGGVLVFKTQDTVESGRQVWNHVYVQERATQIGFEAVDLFIQVARSRMTGHNHGRQVHARKYHAFWWALRKRRNRHGYVYLDDHDRKLPHRVDADGNVWVQMPLEEADGAQVDRMYELQERSGTLQGPV